MKYFSKMLFPLFVCLMVVNSFSMIAASEQKECKSKTAFFVPVVSAGIVGGCIGAGSIYALNKFMPKKKMPEIIDLKAREMAQKLESLLEKNQAKIDHISNENIKKLCDEIGQLRSKEESFENNITKLIKDLEEKKIVTNEKIRDIDYSIELLDQDLSSAERKLNALEDEFYKENKSDFEEENEIHDDGNMESTDDELEEQPLENSQYGTKGIRSLPIETGNKSPEY